MAQEVEEKKVVSRIKSKKKIWCKIIAPQVFGNREVGESYLASATSAVGRIMSVNLRELTGNMKDQNVYLYLQVTKAEGNQLRTAAVGYELLPAAVRRMIRKGNSRLDDYFTAKTKGGKTVIVKTLVITLNKAQRAVSAAVRKELKKSLIEEINRSSFDSFITNVAFQKVQSALKKKLSKIYPLRDLILRVLRLKENGVYREEIVIEDKTETKPAEAKMEEKSEVSEKKIEEAETAEAQSTLVEAAPQ